MEPPPYRCCCTCGGPRRVGLASWMQQLLAVDFSTRCVRDRVCSTCGGAAFCVHRCGEHHRGHDTVPTTDGDNAADHRRDSFCIGCCVAFCSELCAHHRDGVEGHEVIPVHECCGKHILRSTWSPERSLAVFSSTQNVMDEDGNLVTQPVPMRRTDECPSWMFQLGAADFSRRCARDRVCNTCGDGFCGHCCGAHHRGHDTAATADDDGAGEHQRDSFSILCSVPFCSELCTHHHTGGDEHEVIPIDKYGDRYFVRSTGMERWFTPGAFGGIQTFEDKDGNLMVPLGPRRQRTADLIPEPGLKYATRHHCLLPRTSFRRRRFRK